MVNVHSWNERISCGHVAPGEGPNGHALPGDSPSWPRDRDVMVKHTKLDVRLDLERRGVSGTVTHTVRAFEDGLRALNFDAIDLRIGDVAVDGKKAKHGYDGRALTVQFPAAASREADMEIAINYEANPKIGLYFVGPDAGYPDKPNQVWSQNQDEDGRFWFPCVDDPGQKHSFELIVTVPGSWYALSNGSMVSDRANADGTRTFHWRQDKPLPTYLMTLAAGEFKRIDASRVGLPIDYIVESKDEEDGQRTFANTPEMISLFESISGVAYPWDKYSQVVVRDFVFGGMENTSATTMTHNILFDAKAAIDFTSDPLISHELAHMWWGDLLTCRHWSHGWLNEGFATYFEMLWDEHHLGMDEYRQGAITNTELYLSERYRRPIVSNVFREPIDLFDRHLYEKGSLVLHMLRLLLGDEAFFRALRRYCGENQHRSVMTSDLIDAIRAETGKDLEWFFDQWVFKPGHPKLKVSWSWDESSETATVRVKQTQDTKDGTPIFRLPLTIDFSGERGRPKAFPVVVDSGEQSFVFALAAKPVMCRFDPHNAVLKEIEFEKSTGELAHQLRADDDIAGRQFAATELGKKGSTEALNALETAVMRDRYWGVQAAAAKALGVLRSEAARDALIRCLAVRQPKARRAVVAALGEFRGDQAAYDAVAPFAASDASWFVEAEAHRTLGKLRSERSYDALVAGMERDSFRQVVRSGCIDGFVELRDERGLEPLFEAAAYGAPTQSRHVALGAIGRLGAFFPERKKELADRLLPFLDDPGYQARIAAANALKALNEPTAAAALDRMAARELDGRPVRIAREAALALRRGPSTEPEVRNLRDEFEQLKAANATLRERLDKLEPKKA
ncbi:MAG: M1 family aminopeptidase [Dehalococcoidia bacterium]